MMHDEVLNIRVLAPSRKRRRVGEIFVLSVRPDEYYWGRVIALDTKLGFADGGVILAYIYNVCTRWKEPIPELRRTHLLIPPFGCENLPWSRGYFETVGHLPLTDADVLPQHCFRHPWDKIEEYYDEHGNRLDKRIEPCGTHALTLISGINSDISNALGLPVEDD